MKDKIEQDIVEISFKDYKVLEGVLAKLGLKANNLVYIGEHSFNLHMDNYSFCYSIGETEDKNKVLFVFDNEEDSWGFMFDPRDSKMRSFKHRKGEHEGNEEEIKRGINDRQNALTAYFVIQHYLKNLPEIWTKNGNTYYCDIDNLEIKEA